LHGRGMGAQDLLAVFEEKRIMHIACGMTGREIQRCEIMKVVFNVRPFRDRETHVGEDNGHFLHDL